jgi:intracellular multiplication protein IcmL
VDSGLKIVAARNKFYQDGVHRLFIILFLSFLLNILGVYYIYHVYTHPPAPVYFPTSSNGRIAPLIPLSQANMTDQEIKQWANLAIIAAYSYNYVNYRTELEAASEFFTGDGWNTFIKALKSSNNLQAIINNKFVMSASATEAPIIEEKGVINGVYSWRITMPILVTYQSSALYSQTPLSISILVSRESTLNTPKGIGIAQFVSTPIGGSTE